MIDALYGRTMQILEKAMSLRMARQGMLAANIANAETPGYRAVDIDFRETMSRLMEKQERAAPTLELTQADPRHFSLEEVRSGGADREKLVFAAGDEQTVGNDSNSVSMEEQLARLQANTMLFNATAQILNKKLAGVKNAIDGSARV